MFRSRKEGALKREKALAYAFSHQVPLSLSLSLSLCVLCYGIRTHLFSILMSISRYGDQEGTHLQEMKKI